MLPITAEGLASTFFLLMYWNIYVIGHMVDEKV